MKKIALLLILLFLCINATAAVNCSGSPEEYSVKDSEVVFTIDCSWSSVDDVTDIFVSIPPCKTDWMPYQCHTHYYSDISILSGPSCRYSSTSKKIECLDLAAVTKNNLKFKANNNPEDAFHPLARNVFFEVEIHIDGDITRKSIKTEALWPDIEIRSPASGSSVNRLVDITLGFEGSYDPDLVRYEYSADNSTWETIAIADTYPFSIDWNVSELEDGQYTLKATPIIEREEGYQFDGISTENTITISNPVPTPTPTPTPSPTPSSTPSTTPSATPTPSPSITPSATPSITPSPTQTATQTPGETPMESPEPKNTPTPSESQGGTNSTGNTGGSSQTGKYLLEFLGAEQETAPITELKLKVTDLNGNKPSANTIPAKVYVNGKKQDVIFEKESGTEFKGELPEPIGPGEHEIIIRTPDGSETTGTINTGWDQTTIAAIIALGIGILGTLVFAAWRVNAGGTGEIIGKPLPEIKPKISTTTETKIKKPEIGKKLGDITDGIKEKISKLRELKPGIEAPAAKPEIPLKPDKIMVPPFIIEKPDKNNKPEKPKETTAKEPVTAPNPNIRELISKVKKPAAKTTAKPNIKELISKVKKPEQEHRPEISKIISQIQKPVAEPSPKIEEPLSKIREPAPKIEKQIIKPGPTLFQKSVASTAIQSTALNTTVASAPVTKKLEVVKETKPKIEPEITHAATIKPEIKKEAINPAVIPVPLLTKQEEKKKEPRKKEEPKPAETKPKEKPIPEEKKPKQPMEKITTEKKNEVSGTEFKSEEDLWQLVGKARKVMALKEAKIEEDQKAEIEEQKRLRREKEIKAKKAEEEKIAAEKLAKEKEEREARIKALLEKKAELEKEMKAKQEKEIQLQNEAERKKEIQKQKELQKQKERQKEFEEMKRKESERKEKPEAKPEINQAAREAALFAGIGKELGEKAKEEPVVKHKEKDEEKNKTIAEKEKTIPFAQPGFLAKTVSINNENARVLFDSSVSQILEAQRENGAIISGTPGNRSYVLPREQAFCTLALLKAGKTSEAKKALAFALNSQNKKDGNFPVLWDEKGNDAGFKPAEPDSTALIALAFAEYVIYTKDFKFAKKNWSKIGNAIDFITGRMSREKNLVMSYTSIHDNPSQEYGYEIWTNAVCISTLSKLKEMTAELKIEYPGLERDKSIRKAMENFMWNSRLKTYIKTLRIKESSSVVLTPDASVLALSFFEVFPINNKHLKQTIEPLEEKLKFNAIGGISKQTKTESIEKGGFGASLFFSLLLADYYTKSGNQKKSEEYLRWTMKISDNGLLPEQISLKKDFEEFVSDHTDAGLIPKTTIKIIEAVRSHPEFKKGIARIKEPSLMAHAAAIIVLTNYNNKFPGEISKK